jgi:hypothetical protein
MSSRGRNSSILIVLAFVTVTAVLIAPVQAAGRGNKWIALRWRFQPGERIEYTWTETLSGDAEALVAGTELSGPATVTMRTNSRWDVVDVDREGTATVNMAVDEIRGNAEVAGERMDLRINASGIKIYEDGGIVYDSVRMGGSRDRLMGRLLDAWMLPADARWTDVFGKGITARVTKRGELIMPDSMAEEMLRRRWVDGLRTVRLPERLVRPGEEWTVVIDFSPFWIRRQHLLFEGIEDFNGRTCAKLVTESEVELCAPSTFVGQEEGASFDASGGGRSKGDAYWDVEQGRTVWAQFALDVDVRDRWGARGTPGSTPGTKATRMTYNSKVEYRLR